MENRTEKRKIIDKKIICKQVNYFGNEMKMNTKKVLKNIGDKALTNV